MTETGVFMKKIIFALMIAISLFAFGACSDDDENGDIPDYDISDLYGYTYIAKIDASSGNTLTPEMTIFDSRHIEWNMSSSGMASTAFFYSASETAANVYKMYWYASESALEAGDTGAATMTVTMGINSETSISVIGMESTVVEMSRKSGTKRTYGAGGGTTATSSDITITPSGEGAEWFEDSTAKTGTIATGISSPLTAGDGTVSLTVTKTDGNTATVTIPAISGMGMTITSFDVAGCSVTKDGDVYYFSKGEFTAESSFAINGTSLVGKYEDGKLTVRLLFKPGAMPMDLIVLFASE